MARPVSQQLVWRPRWAFDALSRPAEYRKYPRLFDDELLTSWNLPRVPDGGLAGLVLAGANAISCNSRSGVVAHTISHVVDHMYIVLLSVCLVLGYCGRPWVMLMCFHALTLSCVCHGWGYIMVRVV